MRIDRGREHLAELVRFAKGESRKYSVLRTRVRSSSAHDPLFLERIVVLVFISTYAIRLLTMRLDFSRCTYHNAHECTAYFYARYLKVIFLLYTPIQILY